MSITHYDPLSSSLRMFEDAVSHLMSEPRSSRPWSPAVDIFETDNEIVLRADLPDVELKDIDVRIENQTLTLKGERKFEKSEGNKGFHRIERSFGSFVRSFAVPATLETEKVTAEFKNGVLTIRLPIKEAAKPKQVKVEVKS